MSLLPISQSSSNRPTEGTTGSVFFEPGSNKIIIKKTDGSFRELSTQASQQTDVPAGVLNYPGGLYSDTTGTYVLNKAPAMHLSSTDPSGTIRDVSYAQGDMVTVWGDCSGNGNHVTAQNSSDAPVLTDVDGHAAVLCETSGSQYEPIKGYPMIKTVFMVQSGLYVTPFGDYLWGLSSNHGGNIINRYFNKDFTPNKHKDTTIPCIRCALLSADSNHALTTVPTSVWDSDGGAAYTSTSSVNNVAKDSITFLHRYNMNNFEFIFFEQTLTLAEMNVVFNYLKNKYDGLGSISSLAAPLTF